MANIHAINAQGTEYGIIAKNGITQEQVDAIATIGDVANLETTDKSTLVGAVNEVNEKLSTETVIYENPSPKSGQQQETISVSGLANAKALKITFGMYSSPAGQLEEKICPILPGKLNTFKLSQSNFNNDDGQLFIRSRTLEIYPDRASIRIYTGNLFVYDLNSNSASGDTSSEASKVIKITAIF